MKHIAKLISIFILIFSVNALSAQDFNPEDYREAQSTFVNIDDTRYYILDVPVSPYVIENQAIQIFNDEEINIEIELDDYEIVSMKAVKEIVNPEKTITIKLNQVTKRDNPEVHDYSVMLLKNRLDKDLNYKAMMYIFGHDNWIDTSVVPVPAELQTSEIWPNILLTLVLYDFKFTPRTR